VYGIAMILIVFFLPRGIVPALVSWWERKTGKTPTHTRTNPPKQDQQDGKNGSNWNGNASEAMLASKALSRD
jgi:hypothetical protein